MDARRGEGEDDAAAHWLDSGVEHPHRIALSVRTDALPGVLDGLRAGFERRGVRVQLITSGCGDWRYVDCVAKKGGKLAALEYVRTMYGIDRQAPFLLSLPLSWYARHLLRGSRRCPAARHATRSARRKRLPKRASPTSPTPTHIRPRLP